MDTVESSPLPLRSLTVDGTEVVLLGTAHVSRQSAEDVRAALGGGDFDAVAVELCQPRFQHLMQQHDWAELDMLQIVRSGRTGMVAAQLALSAYQKRLADQLGVEPGGEMRAAAQEAQARGLPLWLIDRNIGITMKRVLRAVPWYQRAMLFSGLFTSLLTSSEVREEDIENLKEGDILEATFTEFANRSPRLYEALVAERDRYMAAKLLQHIRASRPRRILAVVGAGHLKGLAEQLTSLSDPQPELQRLEATPAPRTRIAKLIPWIIAAIVLTGFAIGFSRGPELGWRLVGEWVAINGVLTAVAAILAAAHPLTVIAAALAAPWTSFNPTLSAGMVAAAVQTFLRPPHVRDFEALRSELTQLRGWWRNRVGRVLLAFVFCTIASASATYIAGFRIFGQLAR